MRIWTSDELNVIGNVEEMEITTAHEDGSLRKWVPIWVVRDGDDLYVRSYRGLDGAWYRNATRQSRARIKASGLERDVVVDHADAALRSVIDGAYRTKYARYADTYMPPMLTERVASTTVRLSPAERTLEE